MNSENRPSHGLANVDWGKLCSNLWLLFVRPVQELYFGIRRGSIPWSVCLSVGIFLEICILLRWDYWLFSKTGLGALYPHRKTIYYWYYSAAVTSPFWFWAWFRVAAWNQKQARLSKTFQACGLQNKLGKVPSFIFDLPIDECARKLRVSRVSLGMDAFKNATSSIEADLGHKIEDIRENISSGTVDIIYATKELSRKFELGDLPPDLIQSEFIVGKARAKEIRASLLTTPHLLIAGETGSGKSTFLRQFITTNYLKDNTAQFLLIDLKGEVEFQLFRNLRRAAVFSEIGATIGALRKVQPLLKYRLALLKVNGCTNLGQFLKIPFNKRKYTDKITRDMSLGRYVIVVDEAADLFLVGGTTAGEHVHAAKSILGEIARKGRAVGIHLVVATQKPDKRALDSQIKSNLVGALCFRMTDNPSSILVLGNGRATDLPRIDGRAIWKRGSEMVEVQTPLLDERDARRLLSAEYQTANAKSKLVLEDGEEEGASDHAPSDTTAPM